MNFLYLDLVSGASGDMLLSSLIDMGYPPQHCIDRIKSLNIEEVRITSEKVDRNGIHCTLIHPEWQEAHEYRHYTDIMKLIRSGTLEQSIVERSEKVFTALASAEAQVHGIHIDKVHFHEIGALDTIIDIVGFCCAMEYFKIDKVYFPTITDGYGTVKAAHGMMPIPVPAVSQLIKGFKFKSLPVETELLTPTGAAILVALGEQVDSAPQGTVINSGFGCGSKVFKNHPNYLRATLFSDNNSHNDQLMDSVTVIESDMDHISGELMGYTTRVLFNEGALDVVWVPVFMKKGRPGYRLSVISRNENVKKLVDKIISETRTLGVRIHQCQRFISSRESVEVKFQNETVSEKRCSYNGQCFSKLEFDALEALAAARGVPVLNLMEEYISKKKAGV